MPHFYPSGTDQKTLTAFQALKRFSSLSPLNTRIVPVSEVGDVIKFIAPLYREKLKVSKQELSEEYFTLGRVKKILKEKETYDLLKLPIKMNKKVLEDILKSFSNMPSEVLDLIGKKPTIEDFQVSYPAVILTTIAIYQ